MKVKRAKGTGKENGKGNGKGEVEELEGELVRYFGWGNQGKLEVLWKGYFKRKAQKLGEPSG
jgi:hypothetical protein